MDLKPFVKISFKKLFLKNYLKMKGTANLNKMINLINETEVNPLDGNINLGNIQGFKENEKKILNKILNKVEKVYGPIELNNSNLPKKIYDITLMDLEDEGRQSFEALYHNLNTLESRQGRIGCRL